MEEAIQAASERVKAIAPLIDENGRKLIIDSLTNVNADPWQSMAILQRRFSHNLPTTESATQLLIAMESDNASISVSLFESLSSHLESMVGKLSQVALEDLLHETIKYIRIKELKSIPVSIMKKMSIIPAKYLQALISGSTLTEFPLDVRRQAWETEKGKSHFIKSIDDVLQEGVGEQIGSNNASSSALDAKKLESHAKSISDMIMYSRPLFGTFGDHCSERTITQYLAKCASVAAVNKARLERHASSQNSMDIEGSAVGVLKSTPAAVPDRSRTYNYAALLQRVIMALQEANRKVKFADSLHDFATLLDRGRRQNRLDPAAVSSLFDCARLIVRGCASIEEKIFKTAEDVYWEPRGGKPVPSKLKISAAKLSSAPRSKAVKVSKPRAPRKAQPADDFEDSEDGLSDTDVPKSSRSSGGSKRSRSSAGGKSRKRTRIDDSDSDSSGEAPKEKPIAQDVLEPLLNEALEVLRSYDHNGVFQMEVTNDIASGYSDVVKNPMYMDKMQNKVDGHLYHTLREFDGDVQLMVRNCEKYNGKASDFTKLVNSLKRTWIRTYEDFRDRLASGAPKMPLAKSAMVKAPSAPKPKKAAVQSDGPVRSHSAAVSAGLAKLMRDMESIDPDTSSGALLKRVLDLAWEYLSLVDEKKTFAQPVSDKIAPGYSRIIKNKMALSNMKTKIFRSDYNSLEDFQEDVQLITDNCRKYNVGSEAFVKQALDLLSAWNTFYKAAAKAWPAITAAFITGDDDEASEASDTEDVPVNSDDAPKELVLNAQAGVRVKVPPADYGHYLVERDPIELPHIITAQQVREVVGSKDVHSHAVLRAIMTAGWEYLTALDTEGHFAAPVMTLDYLKTIASPMDLSTIRLKIDRRKYKTLAEFDQDVTLMLHNCFHYNEEGAWVALFAEQMQFGWYLCKKNIESVVSGNPSLEVELLPPHLEGSGDYDDEQNEPAPLPVVKEVESAQKPSKKQKEEPAIVRKQIESSKPSSPEEPVGEVKAKLQIVLTQAAESPQTSPPVELTPDSAEEQEETKIAAKDEDTKAAVEQDTETNVTVEREEKTRTATEREGETVDVQQMVVVTEEAPPIPPSIPIDEVTPADPPSEDTPSLEAESRSSGVVEESESFVPIREKESSSPESDHQSPVTSDQSTTFPADDSELVLKVPNRPRSPTVSPLPVPLLTVVPVSLSGNMKINGSASIASPIPSPTPLPESVPIRVSTVSVASTTSTVVPDSQAPIPSSLLVSLRRALDAFGTPKRLLNGRVVDGPGDGLYLNELPSVVADSQLRWALTLLKDFSVQALLRKQFAMRLRDLVVASGDTSGITQISADAANTLGHFANKVLFPHADVQCRQLFQLCQMSFTYADHIDRIDDHVLRVYIPLLVFYVVQPSGEAPKVVPDSERAQVLTTTARAVVKSVLEHPVAANDNVFSRWMYTTCFSDKVVLRDFLESIAKHMINMKLKG